MRMKTVTGRNLAWQILRRRRGTYMATSVLALVLVVGAAGFACVEPNSRLRNDPSSPTGTYIPTDLCDALRELGNRVPAEDLRAFANDPNGVAREHFGMGIGIRNSWLRMLTREEGGGTTRLAQYFVDHGVCHPENMSALILQALWLQLRGQPISVVELLDSFKRDDERECGTANLSIRDRPRCGCPTPFDVSACSVEEPAHVHPDAR